MSVTFWSQDSAQLDYSVQFLSREFRSKRIGVRDTDRGVELNHLPFATFLVEDGRHAEPGFGAVRQPQRWLVGRPTHAPLSIALRVTGNEGNTGSAHLLQL